MKLTKIEPRGFCNGVINSWRMILETIKKYKNKKIYMLGWFVHNKDFVKSIENQGVILLDDTIMSRYDLIKNTNFNKGDVIVFSAHGTPQEVYDLATKKDLIIVDTTCIDVKNTQNKIKELLNNKYQVIYIGKEGHPESESCISISSDIIFITQIEQLDKLKININQKTVVLNQTTLSIFDLYKFHKKLKEMINNIEIINELCNATTQRAEAVINIDKSVDLLLIVGDLKSNNSNSLYKIGKSIVNDTYLISNLNELNYDWFENKKHIAITSGASTPTWVTNAIIDDLIKKCNINND